VVWKWTEARRADHPVIFEATYDSPPSAETAAGSVAEIFGLIQPMPIENIAKKTDKKSGQAGAEPTLVSIHEKAVKISGQGLKRGRYYIRGQPEFIENPISGEKTQVSAGAVRGLVEIETVENGNAAGRLLEGEGSAGDRLESAE
jgi:hypothetical protein